MAFALALSAHHEAAHACALSFALCVLALLALTTAALFIAALVSLALRLLKGLTKALDLTLKLLKGFGALLFTRLAIQLFGSALQRLTGLRILTTVISRVGIALHRIGGLIELSAQAIELAFRGLSLFMLAPKGLKLALTTLKEALLFGRLRRSLFSLPLEQALFFLLGFGERGFTQSALTILRKRPQILDLRLARRVARFGAFTKRGLRLCKLALHQCIAKCVRARKRTHRACCVRKLCLNRRGAFPRIAQRTCDGLVTQEEFVERGTALKVPRSNLFNQRIERLGLCLHGLFYVALSSPTIDWPDHDGVNKVPIEERGSDE